MDFELVVFGSHFACNVALLMESNSLILFGVGVLFVSQADSFLGLFVYTSLFLHLGYVFARLKYEKHVPEALLKIETVLTLVGGPFLVCLLSYLLHSPPRISHVIEFGCLKFLVGILWHGRALVKRTEVLLASCLFFLFGVAPLVVSTSSRASVVVALGVFYLAALTRRSGARFEAAPSIALLFFYLVVSRAFLPFVERELLLPLMMQNFLRSFVAFVLFLVCIIVVRLVPWLNDRVASRPPSDWDRYTVMQLFLFSIGQSQLPVILIGLAVHNLSTPFSLVSVLIATTPVFATILKGMFLRSMDFLQLLFVALGVCGAVLVSLSQLSASASVGGILLPLLSALIWAASGILHEKYLVHVPLLPKACLQSLFGALFALGCSLAMGEHVSFSMFDKQAVAYLAFLALGFSFVSLLATVFLLSAAGKKGRKMFRDNKL